MNHKFGIESPYPAPSGGYEGESYEITIERRLVVLEAKLEKLESVWEHIATMEAKVAAPHKRLEALEKAMRAVGVATDANFDLLRETLINELAKQRVVNEALKNYIFDDCQITALANALREALK